MWCVARVNCLVLLMEGPFMLFTLSSHLVLGITRLLFPLISRSITSFSIPRSTTLSLLASTTTSQMNQFFSAQLFSSSRSLLLQYYWEHQGLVPARYVRQSQLCPQLDVSDKNDKKTQDMSDRARYVRQKL